MFTEQYTNGVERWKGESFHADERRGRREAAYDWEVLLPPRQISKPPKATTNENGVAAEAPTRIGRMNGLISPRMKAMGKRLRFTR